jgi:hypothetical protein
MIKQQIFLDNKCILTIFHDKFEDYPENKKIKQNKKIGNYQVEFSEEFIRNNENEEIKYDKKISGFLERDNKKNPYSTYCCNYIEYITYDKQGLINKFLKEKNIFNKMSDFIREWTGLSIKRSPYLLFNTLIYNHIPLEIKMKLDDSGNKDKITFDILENDFANLIFIIKFKINDLVVDSKKYMGEINEAFSEKEWNLYDLEVYTSDDDLVYANYDASFISSINVNMNIVSNKGSKKLNTSSKTVKLKSYNSEPIEIGEFNPKKITDYLYQENSMAKKFSSQKLFHFLTENQYHKALDIFEDIADSSSYNNLWIFDPYAINYKTEGGKSKLEDIYSVIANTLSMNKKIVYEFNNSEEDPEKRIEICKNEFEEFEESITSLKDAVNKKGERLNLEFKATTKHFHDRFIFLENCENIKGYILGTSFNSFGENYSTIIELTSAQANDIFEKLKGNLLSEENNIFNKEI